MAVRKVSTNAVIGNTYRNAQATQLEHTTGITSWTRPADWLALPAASESFVGLIAVYDHSTNFVALSAAGNYTIDWGDGSAPEDIASGIAAEHTYVYGDLGAGTFCSRGYRQAIVTITPQAGQSFTAINLQQIHSAASITPYNTPWLDIGIDGVGLTSITIRLSPSDIELVHLEHATLHSPSLTDMSFMFSGCSSLQSVNITGTENVTSTLAMFSYCYQLQTLLSFNTAAVTDMSGMFADCHSLQTIPLFNTTAVLDMSNMFSGCYTLRSIPLLDTSMATNMGYMFSDCSMLITIPLLNTSNVIFIEGMFMYCETLQSVPALNTAAVTDMTNLFFGCTNLHTVGLMITSSVTTMTSMFFGCNRLRSAPLFDTAAVTDMSFMFDSCENLRTVPLFDTSSLGTAQGMFQNCASLTTVPLFDTSSVTNMNRMFAYCVSLGSVPPFDTSLVTNMSQMFIDCYTLQTIPAFDVSSVVNFSGTFQGTSIARIQATGFQASFSILDCKLGTAELDELYTNIGTASGKILTARGNPGTTGHTPSIATAKGWTVLPNIDPSVPTTGLISLIDATSLSGLADNDVLPATIYDLSPTGGNNATRSSSPTYRTNVTPNGSPAMRANTGYLTLPSGGSGMWSGKSAGHLFVYVKQLQASGEGMGPWRIGGNDYFWYPYSDDKIYDGALTTSRYNFTPTLTTRNVWRILEVSCGGGSWTMKIDGITQHTQAASFVKPTSIMLLTSTISRDNIMISEFLAYDQVLSSQDASDVRDYLTAKYGATG